VHARLLALHPDAAVLDHGALAERPAPETGPPGNAEAEAEEGASPDPDPAAILAALRAERGNVKQTASALGISRGRLYRLMEKIGSVDLDGIRQSEDE
jgi:transcriptional regulator of acetoin/glycerol metabolism